MEHWRNALAIKEDRDTLINYFSAKKNTTSIDYEDLYSDLSIAVIEAIDEWKPSDTYPYLSMYVNLKVQRRYQRIVKDDEKKQAFLKENKQTEDFIFETNDKAISDFERTEDRIVVEQFWKLFKKYGSRLTAKERAYIAMNYGFGGLEPMSHVEIGKIFGVTKKISVRSFTRLKENFPTGLKRGIALGESVDGNLRSRIFLRRTISLNGGIDYMLRIGKLTGKIYDENVEPSSIGESCITVTRKEDLDTELKRWKMDKLNDDCCFCRRCPEYQIET